MQLNFRTKERMENEYREVKNWLESTQDKQVEEIGTFFDKRSAGYDKMRMDRFWDEYKIIPDFLPDHFKTLLDVGCGSGFEFNAIFKKYPEIKVTGIDICQAMLDLFKSNFGDRDIELIEADYFDYPFEETQYDVVLSVQSLHHFTFDKKRDIYRKIFDSTKDNGFYYELDYMAQSEEFEALNLEYYDKRRMRYKVPEDVFVHIDIPLTVENQIELLKLAGFKKVDVLNKPFLKSNTVFIKASK